MTVINFFLTRHGETQWNKVGKFQGQFDSPLTEKGYRQARAIAAQLNTHNVGHIVSSTLPRAEKTAEICQAILNTSLTRTSALIERNFGDWQGKHISEVKPDKNFQAIFHQVNTVAPPNGESGIDCAVRFQQALIDISNTVQADNDFQKIEIKNLARTAIDNILIVSHGDILRCFLSLMVDNFSDEHAINTHKKAFDNGCIFQITYQNKKQVFTLVSTLDITQLPAVAIPTT
jgi:broad specificity phosphatase PhoE